ncbi:MAG: hypothetical protein FDX21_01515 [Chlorobium sp.]|nr:MAG: hypothetical protein FDX21_01515 [Chlorobium sp.]
MSLKKQRILLVLIGAFVPLLGFVPQVSATPAFSRQTGQSCAACHFQRYPLLNAYGRSFKANGYTQTGKQETIEDNSLSLPVTLNAAVVTKLRYVKTNGVSTDGTNGGEFNMPDEASLFLAGRVAKNIGYQADISLGRDKSLLAGFKMPFVFPQNDFIISAIPFFTDTQGPAYGYELLNTGAVEFSRPFENAAETSAQQYLVQDANEANNGTTGVALVFHHKYGYLSYTPYITNNTNDLANSTPHKFMSYVRGVVTPAKVGNFELAAGFQLWKGTSSIDVSGSAGLTKKADVWAIDGQAQGKVGSYPLGVYVAYGSAKKSDAASGATPNDFNESPLANKTAFTIAADMGIVPSKLGLGLAYRIAHNPNNGSTVSDGENAVTLAATYNVAKNVLLQVNHSFYSYGADVETPDGNQKTSLVLFSAF